MSPVAQMVLIKEAYATKRENPDTIIFGTMTSNHCETIYKKAIISFIIRFHDCF